MALRGKFELNIKLLSRENYAQWAKNFSLSVIGFIDNALILKSFGLI